MNFRQLTQIVQTAKSLPDMITSFKASGIGPEYYDWAMRTFLDSRSREKAIPLKGIFELTPFCNFKCGMCYVSLESHKINKSSLLSADEWESLMSQAVDSGMMFAVLTGGECLTHPDFERLYLFLHKKSVRLAVLTNGELLNDEKISFLKQNPPLSLQITLYGANEDMYERVTGRRAFARVTENIRRAKEAGLPVNITVTPNVYLTLEENKEVIAFAATLGVNFRVNSGLITPRKETEKSESFRDLAVDDYMELIKLEKSLKGELPPSECIADLPETGGKSDGAPKGIRCGGARSSFNITWEGKIIPCNRLTHICADPLKDGFRSSWERIHGEVMNILLPAECDVCVYKNAQKGCVAGHVGAKAGHASPTQCEWCRAMVKNGFAQLNL